MNMNKHWKIALCFFLAVSLSGCGIKSDIQASRAFDRKVRCETYASKTEQEYRDATKELSGKKDDPLYSVERSFCSSKRNSCICILRSTSVVNGKLFETVQTLDVLTKEGLGFNTYPNAANGDLAKDVAATVKSLE
jgi:hypothetical protein